MAILGSQIRVTYRYTYLGQKCQNVQYYFPGGAAFLTADMPQVLEALWENQKGAFHALMSPDVDVNSFDSLLGEEIGGGLQFAEFAIPSDEQQGDRTGLTLANAAPSFVNFGFRQTVATRLTRPGQKRFPFLPLTDLDGNAIIPTSLSLYEDLAEAFSTIRTLGAPVATGVLTPNVGGTVVSGFPTVFQEITGFVLNSNATSQVSRKIGRGA